MLPFKGRWRTELTGLLTEADGTIKTVKATLKWKVPKIFPKLMADLHGNTQSQTCLDYM